jgi:peptidoglycan/xylan/chitin deacetylase (PgdA/CDA1 family)
VSRSPRAIRYEDGVTLRQLPSRAIRVGARVPGGPMLLRRAQARSLAIVMYHGVTGDPLPVENWCQIAAARFAEQLELLAAHYTLLSLREVVDRLERRAPLPRATAVLTFDDGFRNVFTTAHPLLAKHAAPATVFLVTGALGTRQPAWPDRLFHAFTTTQARHVDCDGTRWELRGPSASAAVYREVVARLKDVDDARRHAALTELTTALAVPPVPADSPLATLDWPEIERLAQAGVDFGSHTRTHPMLARCSEAVQEEELRSSRDAIRERLGRCDLLAYPNGRSTDFTARTQAIAARLGYRCGLTAEPGLNRPHADVFALRRVPVGSRTTLTEFERLMLGA